MFLLLLTLTYMLTTVSCMRLLHTLPTLFTDDLRLYQPTVDLSRVTSNGHTLAVLVCGLQTRLTSLSKVRQVVEPAVAQGFQVSVYMELVLTGYENDGYSSNSTYAEVHEFAHALEQKISGAGGRLEFLDLKKDNDEAAIHASVAIKPPEKSDIGRSVMRRVLSLQRLWERAQEAEPSFVLVTRDDDYWIAPLDLKSFLNRPDCQNTVFTKNCLQFGGLNDKTFLFGGSAARRTLDNIFDEYWDAEFNVGNAERFWARRAQLKGVSTTGVPLHELPTAGALFQTQHGVRTQCLRGSHLCPFGDLNATGSMPPRCDGS